MGSIRNLNIADLINKYKTSVFLETGSGYGTGIFYALQFPFGTIFSVEIDKEQSDLLNKFFRFDPRVKIFNDSSYNFLNNILPRIPFNIPCFIFLDAHFPGADLGKAQFSDEKNENIRMPLNEELKLIKRMRADNGAKDVILIDDVMLYDDDNEYQASHQKKTMDILPKEHRNHLNKFISLFETTHNPTILRQEQGWLILRPK